MMHITPFAIDIPQEDLDTLKQRLSTIRWPQSLETDDWSRGVPKKYLQRVAEYWEKNFDWRAQEAAINQYPQFIAEIDGQPIHFIHVKSTAPNALPLLLSHGYPGSIIEVLPLIERLTKPQEFGGNPEQAFHIVAPSLPGFGFSNPVSQPGWDILRTSRAYAQLMQALGYDRYGVQGSDIGAGICQQLALLDPEHVIGVHTSNDPTSLALTGILNMVPSDMLPETEKAQIARWKAYAAEGKGYLDLQGTRPETIGFALADSPVGQLAWILEKFHEWTHPSATLPEEAVSLDQLLANVSLYWFTRSGASAAHFLYEAAHAQPNWGAVPTVPAGTAIFNAETFIRMILDPEHKALHWSEFKEGGHFPALEAPDLLAGDLRTFFFKRLPNSAQQG